eukprot:GHVS01054766.1.p1 GENE.GHVS01054766.1~~GHVS01054766.1.p1  ORF type:complete len:166 (-),score=30.38 GHVS01054766.1:407-904(-)
MLRDRMSFVTTSGSIVVVEDNTFQRLALIDILTLCGYRVRAFASGEEALEHLTTVDLSTSPVDLILCDIVMPGLDGVALLTAIKACGDEAVMNLPMVMMSANDQVSVVSKCVERGAVDYLVKPIQLQLVKGFYKYFVCRGGPFSDAADKADVYERLDTIGTGASG